MLGYGISWKSHTDPLLPLSFEESCHSTSEFKGLARLYATGPLQRMAMPRHQSENTATAFSSVFGPTPATFDSAGLSSFPF